MLASAGFVALAIAVSNWWIVRSTRDRIGLSVSDVPETDVALVLGTAPTIGAGRWSNPFFEARMNAAAELFRAGKVRHLLLSGDNSRKTYDEPTAMRDALVQRGVPGAAITLDYAGFRTLDSVVRAGAVFQLQRLTVVTDDFHLPRALFLAGAHGLEAFGYQPQPVPLKWSKKTRLREVGSRVKACLDVFILRTEPRFYGPTVEIKVAPQAS